MRLDWWNNGAFNRCAFGRFLTSKVLVYILTLAKSHPLESAKHRCQYGRKFDYFICRLSEEDKNDSRRRKLSREGKAGRKGMQFEEPKDNYRFTE